MKRRELLIAVPAILAGCGAGETNDNAALPLPGATEAPRSAALPMLSAQEVGLSAYQDTALRMADFILGLQRPSGAIPDSLGGYAINEDSNMEYALIGLAAAYGTTNDRKYLDGLRKGVEWLAGKMVMDDPRWAGSFAYYYSVDGEAGYYRTRGVDATSALFVYCAHLHQRMSGSTELRDQYEPHIRAALNFLDTHNTSTDGFSLSSWVGGKLYRYEYTADQIDVYLGWEAARVMFAGEQHFTNRAAFYRDNIQPTFFLPDADRYSIGRDEGGSLEYVFDGFDGIFPSGYVPWVLGPSNRNSRALAWLESRAQSDGSMKVRRRTYALTVSMYLCGCAAVGRTPLQASVDWLCNVMFDPKTGGVKDSLSDNTKYTNVAAFSLIGLLGFMPLA